MPDYKLVEARRERPNLVSVRKETDDTGPSFCVKVNRTSSSFKLSRQTDPFVQPTATTSTTGLYSMH